MNNKYYIFNHGRLLLCDNDVMQVPSVLPEGLICEEVRIFEETTATMSYMARSEQEALPEGYVWMDLRESFYHLPERAYIKAGKANELLYFDRQHQYCGICGSPMEWASAISKRCTRCGEELWPKLSTAIIVLVRRSEKALLVKAKNFRRDYYGLVAGFVETGETLEECVAREVFEETGLKVANIRYFASQPWPYPMGLMVGFQADYVSGEIQLVDGELRDASFFRRDNLPPVPEKLSMARMLIDNWVEGN